MKRMIRPFHYALGVHGLALMRVYKFGEGRSTPIAEKLRAFANTMDADPRNLPVEIKETEVGDGYAAWSETYDLRPNPLISAEEPAVRALIDSVPAGHALDVACGTGRHTAYLVERGFETVGIDSSPEMMALARARLPQVRFESADLSAIPFATGHFDLVLCSLALDHVDDLRGALQEMARVTRPGGTVIISTFHPINSVLGGGAFYRDGSGARGIVREAQQNVSDYLMAAIAAGLELQECSEPIWTEKEAAMLTTAAIDPEIFSVAMVGTPCALLVKLRRR